MSLTTVPIYPFDPNLLTGQIRGLSFPTIQRPLIFDEQYTFNGTLTFARWLYVGQTGNVTFLDWSGVSVTLPNMAAGFWQMATSIMVTSVGTTVPQNMLLWGA